MSVGEVNLLPKLVAEFLRRHPGWECVVSVTTRTGYEVARARFPNLCVFYSPLDFTWSVRRAVRHVRPDLLILAELELWPNLIDAAKAYGARVAVVNGRLSERSFRGYKRVRPLVARTFRRLDLVAAQSEQYARRFRALAAPREAVHVSGSVKFDGAETNRQNEATRALARLAGFGADDIVFLAGSTQASEEQLALAAFAELHRDYPRLKLVVVPRHPERFDEVARLLSASGILWRRRSELDAVPAVAPRVLLVDRMGELGAWWGTAHVAFVGGSLGQRGGQNMIEPAAYGAAVSFGPNTSNFRDVVALLLAGEAAVVVRSGHELTSFVRGCLDHPTIAEGLGTRARAVVLSQLGAAERTQQLLDKLIACDSTADATARSAA